MKNGGKSLILAATCVTLVLAARAAVKPSGEGEHEPEALSSDNPYGAIVNRNIFDLHDPPPNDPSTNKVKEPPTNVKLTGITTIFGNKQALFILNEPGAAGHPPSTHSAILSEGQRSGVLEVMAINPKARTATIKNDGNEFTLNIETNKAAPAGSPIAGGVPGARAAGYTPPGGKAGYPRGESLPARPVRSEPGTTYQPSAVSQPGAVPQPNYGYGGATVTPQQYVPPAAQQQQLTAQENYTLMEVQRAQAQSGAADPNLPLILPPTPLSPGANQQEAPSTGASGSTTAPPAPGTRVSGNFPGLPH